MLSPAVISAIQVLASEEAEGALPIPPAAVGVLSIAVFIFLLLVTFAFRSVGTRHEDTHHH